MTLLSRSIVIGTAVATAVAGALLVVSTVPTATAADIAQTTCEPVGATEAAASPTLESFEPMEPERIIDTRDATGGVGEPLDAGCTLMIDMSALGPDDVTAFALSVTVISPEQGFFTAFSCAEGQPGTSSVNARPGIATPNLVVVAPDAAGMVCLFSSQGGQVVIDVSGWWASGSNRFTPVEPVRAYDTRTLEPPAKLPGGAIQDVEVGGLFVPDDAVAVHVNVAAIAPEDVGFLVVYPCGTFPPLASNLNFVAGERRAVAAVVEIGNSDQASAGRICVSTSVATHFIIDVTGYDAPQAESSPDLVLEPLPDTRIVDTRDADQPGVRFTAGQRQRFSLASVLEESDDVTTAMLNVVAVQAEQPSFASVYPCQSGTPTTSSLNYDLGQTANLVVTSLTDTSEFCVYADSDVHIVIDLVGVFRGPPDALLNQLSLANSDGELLAFDQDVVVNDADYTLRCGGGLFDLRIGLAPGATATVQGVGVPERTGAAPDVAVSLPVDALLQVTAQRGAETQEVYVRCLPDGFPELNVTRAGSDSEGEGEGENADGQNTPGWYLTELSGSRTGPDQYTVILDERGVPIWYKGMDKRLIDAKPLSDGNLAIADPERGFGVSETIGHRVYNLEGDLLDVQLTDDPAALPVDHHDYAEIASTPGGQGRAMLSYPLMTGDLSTLVLPVGSFPACDPSVVRVDGDFVDSSIVEMIDDTTQAWRWNASEHFSIAEVSYALCFKNYPLANPSLTDPGVDEPAGEVDAFHINSMQRIEEGGCEPECDYLISARHLDAVFRVDRTTGDVEWILGSLPADPGDPDYIANAGGAPRLNIIGDDVLGGPLRTHDARIDGNRVTMHDNRSGSGTPSRFVEYEIDTSNADPTMWTATFVRQIDSPDNATSGALGSARVADDGSVLMGWGTLQPMFVEYGPDGEELMRIEMPFNFVAYRIVKHPLEQFDIAELRATAGGAFEVPTTP